MPYVFYENFGVPEAVRRRLRLIDLAMRFLIRTYGGRKPDEARRAKTWPNTLFFVYKKRFAAAAALIAGALSVGCI